MTYKIKTTKCFEKGLKRCIKRNFPMEAFKEVVNILENTGKLPSQYKPHKLSGKYDGIWECHIRPDWLLLWMQNDAELLLIMTNTGTHSDIF